MIDFYKTYSSNLKLTTPTKKESEITLKNLFSKLYTIKELLKCNKCKNYYDLNAHCPFITKNGITFCKKCLISKNHKQDKESYIPNLLAKLIIKEIQNLIFDKINNNNFNINEKSNIMTHQKLRIKKNIFGLEEPNTEKKTETKNKKLSLLNLINSNTKYDIDDNNINYEDNKNINFNSNNHIINLNSINVNIETINSNEKEKKKEEKEILKNEIKDDLNINNINNINNDNDINKENNEIKLLDEKCDFGIDIINESLDAIPLNEDKSIFNMSFKKEFSELINKNNNNEKNNYKEKKEDKNELINNDKHIQLPFNKNNDISFGPKSKNVIFYNNDKNNIENNNNGKNLKNNNKCIKINEEINPKKNMKLRQKFLFFDSGKDNEIYNQIYLTQNNDNSSTNSLNINEKKDNNNIKLANNKKKDFNNFNNINNDVNIIFNKKNINKKNIYKNNKIINSKNNIVNQNLNALCIQRIKSNLFKSSDNDNENYNKGWETTRIPLSKSMNLNNFQQNNNSINKNIKELNKEGEINYNLNTKNNEKNILTKNKNKIIISRNKSKNNLLELIKNEQYRTIQNDNNSQITYNKKCIVSKLKKKNNNDTSNNNEDKSISKENFKTIDSNHIIKNNKLNSFQTLINLRNKKIISYKKKNARKPNSISISEKIISKKPISDKIPKLSINTLKDIKEISSFHVSPLNSSRYNTKNTLNNKNKFGTPINSTTRFMNSDYRDKKSNENSQINNLEEDDDLNVNIDLINLEEITLNKKNLVNKTTEKLKKDFEYLFSDNKDNILPEKIKNNKKKYYDIFINTINQLKIDKYYSNMILKFISNDFFVGILDDKNNLPKKGGLYTSIGDHYIGEFINGKKEGYGTIIYNNGTKYEGYFKNDKHDGFGKLIQLDGEMFVGEWKEGKINGNGIRQHINGDKYIGNYTNNIRNGQGHYIFSNGDSYEGNWENGTANGFGKFNFKNGNSYEGNFKQNIIFGKGIFKMNNGDIYNGFFKCGLINGKGTWTNSKGEKYEGNFIDGKKNGFGKLMDKNGKIIHMGNWKDDNFIY